MAKIKTKNKSIEIKDNSSINTACEELGVDFSCYDGTCGICKINIIKGQENLSELTENELDFGMNKKNRLACQCKIKKGEVEIEF